jgi:hypothetical protein
MPYVLRHPVCACATAVLLGTLGWFLVELVTDGGRIGVSERVATGSLALWPLAVVVATRLSRSRTRTW